MSGTDAFSDVLSAEILVYERFGQRGVALRPSSKTSFHGSLDASAAPSSDEPALRLAIEQ
jgi:hypothetical protein